ncbi:hypothetical protein NQ152_00190 [Microbacterium sp. zg.B48]|uniref:hypothetical protein n=1 Tax=Microbacterium sp. zg.B48 TaxID=2969408 RepID=UPI00214C29D9|nr:hypothetical protein [Microbacterium sp. zg.B48]MCR2761922.1 hypothetical protein [Microbacterium sp. zg.B48]
MTDLSNVLTVARGLSLSEPTVGTPGAPKSLARLRTAMSASFDGDEAIRNWLSQEHMAGVVLSTAATMNKFAEVSGKGDPFNADSRSTLISRYNAWAAQLVDRIEAVEAGRGDLPAYTRQLAEFHADRLRNEP